MKPTSILAALLLLFQSLVTIGQSVDTRFVKVANQAVNGGYYEVKLQIAGTSSYKQGLANLKFFFNDTALTSPVLSVAHNFNSGYYDPLSLAISGNRLSVNITPAVSPSGSATDVAVSPEWTDVANIRFTITNVGATSGLYWGSNVVYNDQSVYLANRDNYDLDEPLSESTVLPVTLISFKAQLQQGQVLLKWATATEKNNQEFLVERSSNGVGFMAVSSVKGAGNSREVNFYEATDPMPLAGTNYYRLKQIDFDGKFEYSSIVAVKNTPHNAMAISGVYPNPIRDKAEVRFSATPNTPVNLVVTDLQGKVVWQEKVQAQQELNSYTIDNLGTLNNGIYFIQLANQDSSTTFKVVKE